MSFDWGPVRLALHEPTQSIVVDAPDPFYLRDLIPQSKTLDHPIWNFACKWTDDAARVLRNIGLNAPAPAYNWPGKYKPMSHQLTMIDFMMSHHRCFNLSEMGTMKTASALWAADKMMNNGAIKKVLIVTPLSTLERVWQQDIFDVLMHRRCAVVHGDKEKRLKALNADVDFYILNHDGTKIDWLVKAIRKRKDIDLIIVDEGSKLRNASTDKYKGFLALIKPEQRIWWMTGTPCPNEPTDAWAQARIISPSKVPMYYGTFRRQVMYQITQFKWAPKAGSQNIVYDVLQPAIRFKKSECLSLPPVTTINHQAPLTKEQKQAFQAMKTFMASEVDKFQITAVNAADKVNKLRQLLCGVIRNTETGEYLSLSFGPRLQVLIDIIESASAKVIVVVPFKGIIQALADALEPTYTVGVLNGDVSPRRRNEIITQFKNTPNPHVLMCHPAVMAHGLNLTEADTLIFYAPIYSNDEFQQVTERFNRAGQTRKMTIARIGAHPLEWAIYGLIDERRLSQATILDLYKNTII